MMTVNLPLLLNAATWKVRRPINFLVILRTCVLFTVLVDWFDLSFGRGIVKQNDFPETFIHKFDWYTWRSWLTKADLKIPFTTVRSSGDLADRRARILWMFGQAPEKTNWDGQYTFFTNDESELICHDRLQVKDTARIPVSFADNIHGNIYYNSTIKHPMPVVIWLHPYSYHTGYNEGYGVQGTTIYHRLAKNGFVVLVYDQVGFGLWLLERCDFYERHPKWSCLGRMVYDAHAAVDFLVNNKGRSKSSIPPIRKN